VQRRLVRHRAGTASRYTATRLPVELAWAQEMPDRRAARQKEILIKKLGHGEARIAGSGKSTVPTCAGSHKKAAGKGPPLKLH
jgi:hypothetical protein